MDIQNKFFHQPNISWLIFTPDIILAWTRIRRRKFKKKKKKNNNNNNKRKKNKRKKKKQTVCT
jgi:hypothetical protein